MRLSPDEYAGRLPDLVRETFAEIDTGGPGEGRLAVVTSRARHADVLAAPHSGGSAPQEFPYAAAVGPTPEALDSPVAILTSQESKGLELDAVIVLDPAGILAESVHGGQDLYVAITRTTRRLVSVHDGDLPPVLARAAG